MVAIKKLNVQSVEETKPALLLEFKEVSTSNVIEMKPTKKHLNSEVLRSRKVQNLVKEALLENLPGHVGDMFEQPAKDSKSLARKHV